MPTLVCLPALEYKPQEGKRCVPSPENSAWHADVRKVTNGKCDMEQEKLVREAADAFVEVSMGPRGVRMSGYAT